MNTTLLTIAELLAGEALISPGGPVDRMTAVSDDCELWPYGPAAELDPPVRAEAGAVAEERLVTV